MESLNVDRSSAITDEFAVFFACCPAIAPGSISRLRYQVGFSVSSFLTALQCHADSESLIPARKGRADSRCFRLRPE